VDVLTKDSDREAAIHILASLYGDLQRIAQSTIQNWRHARRRSGTSLVNSVFVRLLKNDSMRPGSRQQLLLLFQEAMRHELIDDARRARAAKRPQDHNQRPLTDLSATPAAPRIDVMAALEELEQLRTSSPEAVAVFEYATLGASINEVAVLMDRPRQWVADRVAFVRATLASRLASDRR
jgi:hypothetical protein